MRSTPRRRPKPAISIRLDPEDITKIEAMAEAKGLARSFCEKRKLAVKTEGFCLAQAKARATAEKPVLFGDVARRYLAWAERERPRSLVFRQCAMKHLVTAFGPKPLTSLERTGKAYERS